MTPAATARALRKTGFSVLGDVPWGTHFCYFYETKQDLLDTLVEYFKVGLEGHELCLWVISPSLTVHEAKQALAQTVLDLDRHLAEGNLEIHGHDDWYLSGGKCDSQQVLQSWREKLHQALAAGYAGLRASGDGGWVHQADWRDFREYEKALHALIADQRRLLLCTYPLTTTSGDRIFDVARTHQVAVARRNGSWEIVETSELKQAKSEIKSLNDELEQRVAERTSELARINEALRSEIAERQLAEAAVRQAEDRIRLVIDTIPSMAWSLGPDGLMDFVNRRRLDYTGLSWQQELEEPMRPVHPEDRPRVVAKWLADFAAGEPCEDEMRLRRADGAYRWFLVRTAPLRDEQGNLVKWYGVSIDIEDRQQAEKQARALIDAIPDQIWSGPPDGTIDYCNERWRSYMGMELEGLRGDGWQSILHPEDRDRVLEAWRESVLKGTPYEQEERHLGADGAYRWFLSRGVPLRDPAGRIVRWYGTNTDIEERKRTAKELEEAIRQLRFLSRRLFEIQEEERRHLARELHDEIGQTLTAARFNLKIMAPDVPPAVADRLADSLQLLDRLLTQVRQLSLDLRPPLLDELGLVPALRWLVDQQARRARLRMTFTTTLEGREIAPAVQTACFRVAQEALTNTIRHAHARSVAVNLRREADRLLLSVRDDGTGFDPAALRQEGRLPSGLGLLSMQERALLVRGDLEVRSAPGQGTEILAWFPLSLPPPPSPTEAV